ncbi:hypothetical protein RHGRI_007842 [Rhododendron griersonianum]|uniref:Uncharacterized protein n=1 Tax=Rhododendron griersonianum TaxID=479676 RepID=A0AAV6L0B3_9ERIC|nr:hypothetical protein RHGRI_007842 [Rhododendron griersonianum]
MVSSANPTPSLIPSDDSSHLPDSSSTLGALSPKNPSPARKLQEVFQVAGERLDSEVRLSNLVRSLEAEMKSSGVLVDCSELKSQLNRLKEHHVISGYQSSVSDACGNPQTLNVNFKIPSGSKIGKGKRDANPAAMGTGESSSSQSAIEDSNGIPSVLADLPHSDELQPSTISETLPFVASDIVIKDSVDKGNVGKGPVAQVLSNQDNGRHRAACDQSIPGQVEFAAGPRSSSTSVDTSVIQAPSDELTDSEDDLLEVLEKVLVVSMVRCIKSLPLAVFISRCIKLFCTAAVVLYAAVICCCHGSSVLVAVQVHHASKFNPPHVPLWLCNLAFGSSV